MVMVKTKKERGNYHDRHAVLYLGCTLTVLGRQRAGSEAEDEEKSDQHHEVFPRLGPIQGVVTVIARLRDENGTTVLGSDKMDVFGVRHYLRSR